MANLHIVTLNPLPKKLVGSHSLFALGPLRQPERLGIEDHLFRNGTTLKIPKDSGTVVLPDVPDNVGALHEAVVVAEFALSLLTSTGHPSFRVAALFSGGNCTHAVLLPNRLLPPPVFIDAVTGVAAARRSSLK
jgi:hypothetical protein